MTPRAPSSYSRREAEARKRTAKELEEKEEMERIKEQRRKMQEERDRILEEEEVSTVCRPLPSLEQLAGLSSSVESVKSQSGRARLG